MGENERFGFGRNWAKFLSTLNDRRIDTAVQSLRQMLEVESLEGKTFLDIGCGSGLFSLAAMKLSARRVHSFDYDSQSVGCAQELRRRFFSTAAHWSVERGDVLDETYMRSLGTFDVVYSWGVLHHTGDMWSSLEHAAWPAPVGGKLFIAIYNDAGIQSAIWLRVKRTYCRLPPWLKTLYLLPFAAMIEGQGILEDILRGRAPWRHWIDYYHSRGMSRWHDIRDWVGGYPYEYAKTEELFDFYRKRGFRLDQLRTNRGTGNNELVFSRTSECDIGCNTNELSNK